MSVLNELYDKAQFLPPNEREQLALMLLDSLPDEEGAAVVLDPDYEAELERRLESIRTGQAKGHDLPSVMQSLRTTLAKRRAS
jgi:putative addiction module component (TIGR02574 family)